MTKFYNPLSKNISILIVEDETLLAMGMKCSLNEFGYKVSGIETTGENAINHIQNKEVDVILMDIHLKGPLDGIQVAKTIWDNHKIPIIFLTSYNDDETIKEAMQSEPYAYLIKPCRDYELKAAIETTINKHNCIYKKNSFSNKNENNILKLKDDLYFDKIKKLLYKKESLIKLTGNETKLIEILIRHKNEPVSFDKLSDFIYQDNYYDIARLRTLIYRFKLKIKSDMIENIFELGYMLKTNND